MRSHAWGVVRGMGGCACKGWLALTTCLNAAKPPAHAQLLRSQTVEGLELIGVQQLRTCRKYCCSQLQPLDCPAVQPCSTAGRW